MTYFYSKERYTPFIHIHLATDPVMVDLRFVPSLLTPCQYSPPRYFSQLPKSLCCSQILHQKIQIAKILVPAFLLPSLHLWDTVTSLSLYFLLKSVRQIECQKALGLPVLYSFSPMSGLAHPSPELQLMPGHSSVTSFLSNKHPYMETPGCFHPDILKVTSIQDTQKHTKQGVPLSARGLLSNLLN